MHAPICNKDITKTKVIVAMSGGVDSSTTALYFKQMGYIVEGLTMSIFNKSDRFTDCNEQTVKDAAKVCEDYGIKHHVLDCREFFEKEVVEKFVKDYASGKTTIPCVTCNKFIKFGLLMDYAMSVGGDFLLTGHYARIKKNDKGKYELHTAIDQTKDQTHFLSQLKPEQLEKAFFPLGWTIKEDTKKMAKSMNFEPPKESQDICFVDGKSYLDVVTRVAKTMNLNLNIEGEILHIETNQHLGTHNGIVGYTIGQRKGIGVAYSEPLYVVKVDAKENIVYVGEEKYLHGDKLEIIELNIMHEDYMNKDEFECEVILRALRPRIKAKIIKTQNGARVELFSPERAITSGQICAMYEGTRVIGSGVIV